MSKLGIRLTASKVYQVYDLKSGDVVYWCVFYHDAAKFKERAEQFIRITI